MTRNILRAFYLAVLIMIGPTLSTARSANLLRNFDFESGKSSPWAFTANGNAVATGELDNEEKHSGGQSFRISNKGKSAPNVFALLSQVVKGLKPETEYRLTVWIKGSNVENASFGGGPGWKLRKRLQQGTYDWTEFSVQFTTAPEQTQFECIIISSGHSVLGATETIWVDDAELVEASEANVTRIYKPTPFENLPASARFYPVFASLPVDQAPSLSIHPFGEDHFGAQVQISRDEKKFFF